MKITLGKLKKLIRESSYASSSGSIKVNPRLTKKLQSMSFEELEEFQETHDVGSFTVTYGEEIPNSDVPNDRIAGVVHGDHGYTIYFVHPKDLNLLGL